MIDYILKLKKEECMGLIEILELFRKDEEDETTIELRHKIKTQFQTQFDEIENLVSIVGCQPDFTMSSQLPMKS